MEKKYKVLIGLAIVLLMVGASLIGYGVYNEYFKNNNTTVKTKGNTKNTEPISTPEPTDYEPTDDDLYEENYKIVETNKIVSRKNKVEKEKVALNCNMTSNKLENFDLAFLQLENDGENTVYSPLSIKYALEMLSEGASGDTKTQIDNIIGKYQTRTYKNSENMSFANALFVRDSYKDNIKSSYLEALKTKYNAEVVYDSFEDVTNINNWVKDKTLGLIEKMYESKNDIEEVVYVLTNALAIDMNWTNQIQCANDRSNIPCKDYDVKYAHEDYYEAINIIEDESQYSTTKFNNSINAKSVRIGASVNKYDIVNTLGKENIRNNIITRYNAWLKETGGCGSDPTAEEYAEDYIKYIDTNYKRIDTSSDYYFDDTNEYKVFAKDLKEYDGMQLQYIGIMPKKVSLKEYIKNTDATKINNIIDNIKPLELSSFEEGYVTKITGTIPLFNFETEIDLINDLKALGITNVFDKEKADLSNLSKESSYIGEASHSASIEFSNNGIKAGAVSHAGGKGDMSCGFEYLYEIPVKEIDLTFDKPYMFIIRNKNTGEVWFVGSVYEPIESPNAE